MATASKKSILEDDNGGGNGESDDSPTDASNSEPSDKPTGEGSEGILYNAFLAIQHRFKLFDGKRADNISSMID